jgi:hypothetical protein
MAGDPQREIRNHHSVGMGGITEMATSAPGYNSVRPESCSPLQVDRDGGSQDSHDHLLDPETVINFALAGQ